MFHKFPVGAYKYGRAKSFPSFVASIFRELLKFFKFFSESSKHEGLNMVLDEESPGYFLSFSIKFNLLIFLSLVYGPFFGVMGAASAIIFTCKSNLK